MTNPSIAQEPYFSFSDLDEFNGQINDSWFGYRNDVEQVLIQSAGKAFMFDWGFGPSESFRTFVLDARILADDEGFSLIGLFCCQSDDNAAYPGVVMDSSGTIGVVEVDEEGTPALKFTRPGQIDTPGHAVMRLTETAFGFEVSVDGGDSFSYEIEGTYNPGRAGIMIVNGGIYAISDFGIYNAGEKALSANETIIEQVIAFE